jgi:hypothetical protein
MSTIEFDPAALLSLDEADWRLLALADETPARLRRPAPAPVRVRETGRDLVLPVGCAAHDAADADPRSWAPAAGRPYPIVEPPSGPGDRERALGPSIAPEL